MRKEKTSGEKKRGSRRRQEKSKRKLEIRIREKIKKYSGR